MSLAPRSTTTSSRWSWEAQMDWPKSGLNLLQRLGLRTDSRTSSTPKPAPSTPWPPWSLLRPASESIGGLAMWPRVNPSRDLSPTGGRVSEQLTLLDLFTLFHRPADAVRWISSVDSTEYLNV